MTKELRTTPDNIFIVCRYRFSGKALSVIKSDMQKFMTDREKDNLYFDFIDWQKRDNEVVILTDYASADIMVPISFDTVFNLDNYENFEHHKFTITKVVFNGWTPVDNINKGHKHIAIIQFDKPIPTIFNSLVIFGDKNLSDQENKLGLCNSSDFESIKRYLKAAN